MVNRLNSLVGPARLSLVSTIATGVLCLLETALAQALTAQEASQIPKRAAHDTARVASVAMHSKMGDPGANLDRIEHWCRKAHLARATFAVFPEECITGSLNKSNIPLDEASRIVDRAAEMAIPRLESISRRLKMTLVVGTIERHGDKFRNSALVVGPKGLLTTFHKLWLPNATEQKYFVAGTTLPIVASQGWTLSVGICADLNHSEYFQTAAAHGAELFLLPVGGSGEADLVGPHGDQTKQAEHHQSLHIPLMQKHAQATGMYVFYANQAGHSGNAWFPGLSLVVDPKGRVVDRHLPTEGLTVTEVSKAAIASSRDTGAKSTAKLCRNSAGESVRVVIVSANDESPGPTSKR